MLLPAPRPVQLAEFKRRPFQEFLEPVHPVCVGVQQDVDDDLTQFFVAMFLLVRTHFALPARDPCDSLKPRRWPRRQAFATTFCEAYFRLSPAIGGEPRPPVGARCCSPSDPRF